MKKILLVCEGGLSSSIMANRIRSASKELGVEVEVETTGMFGCSSAIDKADVVLLGPQVGFHKFQIEALAKGKVPVEVMKKKYFGIMNGKAILERAMELIAS